MRIAIHQPNYIPWCGYFAKMSNCDVFVFLDDAELSNSKSYTYRSLIRDKNGTRWLSVPIFREQQQQIFNAKIADPKWSKKHLNALQTCYGKCSFYDHIFPHLLPLYNQGGDNLAMLNISLIKFLAGYFDIKCRFELSSRLAPSGRGDERLISITKLLGGTTYVSGKGGQNYQNPDKFVDAGICLEEHQYVPIPYNQIHGEFFPGLSILDALFHLGPETKRLFKYPLVKAFD